MKRVRWWQVVALIGVLCAAGEVIAADPFIDQPAPANQSTAQTTPPRDRNGTDLMVIALAAVAVTLFVARKWHRLDAVPVRPSRLPPPVAMALLIGFLLLGQAGVTIAAQVWGISVSTSDQSLHDKARLTLGAYLGQFIVLVSYAFLLANARRSSADVLPSRSVAVLTGFGSFLIFFPIVLAAGALAGRAIEFIRGEPTNPIAHDTLRLFLESPVDGWYIALAVMVIFVTPVMEELFYRGLVQTALITMRVPRWPAILLTSAGFTAMHVGTVEPQALASLFTLSIAFGWAYERTGRLATPIVMHALFNAANLAMARWMI